MKCRAAYFNNAALKRSRTWNIFDQISVFRQGVGGFKIGRRALAWESLIPRGPTVANFDKSIIYT